MYFFSNSPVKWRLTKVVYRKNKMSVGVAVFDGRSLHVSRDSVQLGGVKLGGRRRKIAKEDVASWDPTHLSGTTVTDKHKLEGRGLLLSHFDGCVCGVVATGTKDVNKRGAGKKRCLVGILIDKLSRGQPE
jgi:hypothetical protein